MYCGRDWFVTVLCTTSEDAPRDSDGGLIYNHAIWHNSITFGTEFNIEEGKLSGVEWHAHPVGSFGIA